MFMVPTVGAAQRGDRPAVDRSKSIPSRDLHLFFLMVVPGVDLSMFRPMPYLTGLSGHQQRELVELDGVTMGKA